MTPQRKRVSARPPSKVAAARQESYELEEKIDELSRQLRTAKADKHEALLEVKRMRALVTSSAPILGDLVESDTVEELRSLLLAKEQEAATLQWNLDAALEEVEALRDSPGGEGGADAGQEEWRAGLDDQVAELKEMLAEREAVIDGQKQRLEALRSTFKPPDHLEALLLGVDTSKEAEKTEGGDPKMEAALKENKLLCQELDRAALELGKLEARLARGEFNTFRTRVVRPAEVRAPCTTCVGFKAKLSEAEVARDNALALLNEAGAANVSNLSGGGSILDASANLEAGLKMAELNRTIAEKDKYIMRLSEQAKQQIQEYKEVAKALFGFSLSKHKGAANKPAPGQYQVKSLFAERSGDVLLVQAQDGGKQVDMLSSDYSISLKAHADRFFQQAHQFPPLPALLAAITVEHYDRLVS